MLHLLSYRLRSTPARLHLMATVLHLRMCGLGATIITISLGRIACRLLSGMRLYGAVLWKEAKGVI